MRKTYFFYSILMVAFVFFLMQCADSKTNILEADIPDASMAAYHTDQYVWEKMARSFQIRTESPKNLDWELWPTTTYAYSDPCSSVAWPSDSLIWKLNTPKGLAMLANLKNNTTETTRFELLTLNFSNPYYEELRINKVMFDYIQEMGLYNQNTVYKLAKAGKINFPEKAMMIKAQWMPVDSSQVGKYYTKIIDGTDIYTGESTGYTLMGMVGFHLVTHELPNWVWSTFEYKGNPGMCDYIGCKDKFGNTQAFIPKNDTINLGYSQIGGPSKALLDLFDEFNVPDVFQNYRLKGSQTEYTDNKGDTLILGNSILEMNLVPSSSCISCHARATLNNRPGDRKNLLMFDLSAG
ncbi:MAG: hypothetical protein HKN51_07940, partial [Saprospiraceae bacterium]|nr:hypothetical protein [Saprospiraceae bacterium]